jgi:hypothetical protein
VALTHTLSVRLRRVDWEVWFGRVGLVSRGLLYALVGYLTAAVALRRDKGEADSHEALELAARQSLGHLFLFVIAAHSSARLTSRPTSCTSPAVG